MAVFLFLVLAWCLLCSDASVAFGLVVRYRLITGTLLVPGPLSVLTLLPCCLCYAMLVLVGTSPVMSLVLVFEITGTKNVNYKLIGADL